MNPYVTSTLNLRLFAGISLTMDVNVYDSSSSLPVDLTGCSASLRILQGSTEVLLLTTPNSSELLLDQQVGVIHVVLAPATSAAWQGTYTVYIDLTWPTGANARLVAGTWTYH